VNIDALTTLIGLAEHLWRTNAVKWAITEAEWRTAILGIAAATVPPPDDTSSVSRAIRRAQSAGRRLGNSGEARFGSAGMRRNPDSSWAGKRFYADLEAARRRLAELRELGTAEQGAAKS
jgi:hypothetical protein